MSEESLAMVLRRVLAFQKEAYSTLAGHETSPARSITIEKSYKQLDKLSIKQDDLFRQAIRCVEYGLFRAAHVLAWATLIDFIEEELAKDQFKSLNKVRPKWEVKSLEDLRDRYPDSQVIKALKEIGLCSKTEEKALDGLLNKRNECAHPTDYNPDLNETLGYLSEILRRIARFQQKWKSPHVPARN